MHYQPNYMKNMPILLVVYGRRNGTVTLNITCVVLEWGMYIRGRIETNVMINIKACPIPIPAV